MAGDWIKVEHTTPDKPEVVKLAGILGIDQDAVVGKLLRLWIWADQQSVSGNAITVTNSFLDRLVFCPGFAAGLVKVGWLNGREGLLSIPNFDRHNGQSAKNRANTNRRVANSRKAHHERVAKTCNANVTLEPLQKPLPEKRREEKKENIVPLTRANEKEKRAIPLPETSEEVESFLTAEAFKGALPLQHYDIKQIALLFFNDREASGWVDRQGFPVANWRAAVRAFALRYLDNIRKRNTPETQQTTQQSKTYGY